MHDVIAFHHGMRATGYALGTCNRCLVLLRYAINLAARWKIPGVTSNPTKDVPLFEENNKKERYLSQDEAQRLYEAVRQSDNSMLQFIVPMLILTGARKREVLDSKWEDFDLARRQWRIPVTKTGRPRHVPLSDGVLQLLATVPRDDCPWVFAKAMQNARDEIFSRLHHHQPNSSLCEPIRARRKVSESGLR